MPAQGTRPHTSAPMSITHRPGARIVSFVLTLIRAAHDRARIRRDLRRLAEADDFILRDLGITRLEVMRLTGKLRRD